MKCKKKKSLNNKQSPKMSFCSESRQHSIILGASFFSFQGTYLLLKPCNLRFTICYLGFQDSFFFFFLKSPAAVQSKCGFVQDSVSWIGVGTSGKNPFSTTLIAYTIGWKDASNYQKILSLKSNSVNIPTMLFCKIIMDYHWLVCLFSGMIYCSLFQQQ